MDHQIKYLDNHSINIIRFADNFLQFANMKNAQNKKEFNTLNTLYSESLQKLAFIQGVVSAMIESKQFELFCKSEDGLRAIYNIFIAYARSYCCGSEDYLPKDLLKHLDRLIEQIAENIPPEVYGIQFDTPDRTGNTLLRQLCVYVKFRLKRDRSAPEIINNLLNKVDLNFFSYPMTDKYETGDTALLHLSWALTNNKRNQPLFLLLNALIFRLPEDAWYLKITPVKKSDETPAAPEFHSDFSLYSSPFSELCSFVYEFSKRKGFFDTAKQGILIEKLLGRTPATEFTTILGKNESSPLLDLCYAFHRLPLNSLRNLSSILKDKNFHKQDWLHVYKSQVNPLFVLFLGLKSIKNCTNHPLFELIQKVSEGIPPEEFSISYEDYSKRSSNKKYKIRDISMRGLLEEAITANPASQILADLGQTILGSVDKKCLSM